VVKTDVNVSSNFLGNPVMLNGVLFNAMAPYYSALDRLSDQANIGISLVITEAYFCLIFLGTIVEIIFCCISFF
jgi:hypothetical protein